MNFQTKNNFNKKIKILFFIFFLISALIFPAQKPAQAVFCWFIPCSGIMTYVMDMVKSAATSAIKQKGIQAIDKSINGSAGDKYITNWNEFLHTKPERETKDWFVKDFLTKSTGNKGSSSTFVPKDSSGTDSGISMGNLNSEGVGDNSFKIGLFRNDYEDSSFIGLVNADSLTQNSSSGGNYTSSLVEIAKKATVDKTDPVVTYSGNPSKMFEGKSGFKNLETYTSGINNPWAFKANAEEAYDKKLNEMKDTARTMSVAYQGWVDPSTKVAEGKVDGIPGSSRNLMYAHIKTLGADTIVNSQDIATAIMSTAMNSLTTKAFDGMNSGQSDQSDDSESDYQNLTKVKQNKQMQTNTKATETKLDDASSFDGVLKMFSGKGVSTKSFFSGGVAK